MVISNVEGRVSNAEWVTVFGIRLAKQEGMMKKRRKSTRIAFRFTANRKKDVFRFLLAGLCLFSLIAIYWNQFGTPLDSLSQGYQGFVLKGMHQQKMLDERGVALIKSWLEQKTSPTINPLTILQQHRRSGQPTRHYELAIGMRSSDAAAIREYAIYQTGHTIYLRVEPIGIDRVLDATFSARDLESALKPYISGEFRSTASLPHD